MPEGVEDLKALWVELKAHVERLAAEREHYLEIFERSEAAYLLTDCQGVIQDANGAAVDFLQRRRGHLRGKPIAALVAPEARREFRTRLHDLARSEGAHATWNSAFGAGGGDAVVRARAIGRPVNGIGWLLRTGS